jgi:hypothetical protein
VNEPRALTEALVAADRHPATTQLLQWFAFDHLPLGEVRDTSHSCALLADDMARDLPDGPELTTGLRKLLEAKDCFVRAAIAAQREATTTP